MAILSNSEYRQRTDDYTTSDGSLNNALSVYTAVIEKYCMRSFGAAEYTDMVFDVQFEPLILKHAPINSITSITVNDVPESDADAFDRDDDKAFIYHDGAWVGSDVSVVYTAGRAAPEDVKHVLQVLVNSYLEGTTGGSNVLQQVVSETVFGVASTKYAMNGFDVEAGGHAELGPFTSLLDPYVAESDMLA